MDYTICYAHERNQTSNAHQLALAVVFYNPLNFLYWYDEPAKYAARANADLAFFDACPTSWDETRGLAGEIGEYAVVARRSGARWFLGAITNERARQIEISLDFLGKGRWRAHIFADAAIGGRPVDRPVVIDHREITAGARLALALGASGGQAILFEPVA